MKRSCRSNRARREPKPHVALAAALLFATSVAAYAQAAVAPTSEDILARVKAALRAHERPPFVVYTLVRRDALEGIPDLVNSYTLRVWCRTADGAALARQLFGARTTGNAQFIRPAFDKPIDPGPPTADLLDVIRQTQGPTLPPVAGTAPVIGSVAVVIETHYRVTFAGVEGSDDHLHLEARRDPDHNRLTDLYVDASSYALHRAVAHDHLYVEGRAIPERFEIDFGSAENVPVITAIHGQTDYASLDTRTSSEPLHEVDYRFEQIAFPATLPDWYFEPAQYGAHRDELPNEVKASGETPAPQDGL